PVINTVASNVAETVEQQLPTVAAQAEAAVQEVAQTAPTAEAAPVEQAQPELVVPVPVAPTAEEQNLVALYDRVNPGVVTVFMTTGSGSGFIVDADGYIVTNNHVIEEGGTITILLHDGDTKTAELVGTDSQADIALLKV